MQDVQRYNGKSENYNNERSENRQYVVKPSKVRAIEPRITKEIWKEKG